MINIIILMFGHWIADFVTQSDYVAKNKSKDSLVCCLHAMLYSICMMPFVIFAKSGLDWGLYLLTGLMLYLSHLCIDYVTSKINAWLWSKEEMHWFFVSVGFDQLLHLSILFLLLDLL